jgi:putative sterol carrier protein
MTDIAWLEGELKRRVEGKAPIGKTITFAIKEQGKLRIDGAANPVTIARSDAASDATITISADDLKGLLDGSVNGQSLMMTGRAKMDGNPMVAMKLRDLLV